MKFTIDKKVFETAFAALIRLAANSSVNVVQAVLCKNVLRLSATDMRNTLRLDAAVSSEDEGEFLINAPYFWPVVKELPEGNITFSIQENTILIDWENGCCQFPVAIYSSFPPLPRIGADPERPIRTVILGRKDVLEIVAGVIPATADKEAELRPVLGGLYFDVDGGDVTIVGTDGQLLLTRDAAVRSPQEEPFSFIVPKAAVVTLAAVIPASEETVSFHSDGRIFTCSGEGFRLVSLCIDSKYPAYRSIMPTGEGGHLTVDRKELLSAVRRVAALTSVKDEKDTAAFELTGGEEPKLEIQGQNVIDFSSVKEVVSCEWDGGDIRFGFKVQRLLAMLGSTDSAKVMLVVTEPNRPVLFQPEGDEAAKGLLMPAPVREIIEVGQKKRGKKQ